MASKHSNDTDQACFLRFPCSRYTVLSVVVMVVLATLSGDAAGKSSDRKTRQIQVNPKPEETYKPRSSVSYQKMGLKSKRVTTPKAPYAKEVPAGPGPEHLRYVKVTESETCITKCIQTDGIQKRRTDPRPRAAQSQSCREETFCYTSVAQVGLYMSQSDLTTETTFGAKAFGPYTYQLTAKTCIEREVIGESEWEPDRPPPSGGAPLSIQLTRCVKWGDWTTFNDERYYGCGVKAAQNVLRYFGQIRSQTSLLEDEGGNIDTYQPPLTSDIAVYPNDLATGLQAELGPNYKVTLHHGMSLRDIHFALRNGFPVLALVDNGGHWVTVAAYDKDFGYYVHDNWDPAWRSPDEMDLKFYDVPAWFSSALGGPAGYEAGTIITFEYAPIPYTPSEDGAYVPMGETCGSTQKCCFRLPDGSCGNCVGRNASCSAGPGSEVE